MMKLFALLGTLLLILGSACCFGKEAPNLKKSVENQKITVVNEKKLSKILKKGTCLTTQSPGFCIHQSEKAKTPDDKYTELLQSSHHN